MSEKAKDTVVVRMSDRGKLVLESHGVASVLLESANHDTYPHLYALTPLREGEPKPGETWSYVVDEGDVEILNPPCTSRVSGDRMVYVHLINRGRDSLCRVSDLRPIPPEPEKKRYRLRVGSGGANDFYAEIEAESEEAARASLVVEEVHGD